MAKPVRGVIWQGTSADETYVGTAGNDSLGGQGGKDTIDGGAGNDTIRGHLDNDTLNGGLGADEIFGNEGNDVISGGDGDDYLGGQEGDDWIDGGSGNDFIGSGPGNDVLAGGDGADRFFFAQPFEVVTNHHRITDFNAAQGDFIDLRSIDADGDSSNNSRKANTDFVLVDDPTGAAGTAWMETVTDPVTGQSLVSIYLYTDGDPDAEMRIDVLNVASLEWGSDILG